MAKNDQRPRGVPAFKAGKILTLDHPDKACHPTRRQETQPAAFGR
jgi:hypothetical protein